MKTSHLILGSVLLIAIIGGIFWLDNSSDTSSVDPNAPATVNSTQKASVDDGQESPVVNVPTETSETEEEPIEQTVVVPELELPEGGGIPVDTNHFKIEEVKSDTYLITLYAIINSPSQYQEYQQQLRDYKAEALEYLENNNIDADTITINYSPEEAADL